MTPDSTKHNPDPAYLRGLVERSGLSQRECARRIGLSDRAMRYYLAGERKPMYAVQFAMEALASDVQIMRTATKGNGRVSCAA